MRPLLIGVGGISLLLDRDQFAPCLAQLVLSAVSRILRSHGTHTTATAAATTTKDSHSIELATTTTATVPTITTTITTDTTNAVSEAHTIIPASANGVRSRPGAPPAEPPSLTVRMTDFT